jgi:uncharacterized repeat protein (TIGR03803 family)
LNGLFRCSKGIEAAPTSLAICLVACSASGDVNLTTLVSFNGTNGSTPSAALVLGGDGNFYGTAQRGGQGFNPNQPSSSGSGTIFQMTPTGTLSVILTNSGTAPGPNNPLLPSPDGSFYFPIYGGGLQGKGSVFNVTTNGTLSMLYSFSGSGDGYHPNALTWGTDGSLYGTTSGTTTFSVYGSVFRLTTNGTLTTLVKFGLGKGYFPVAGLVQGSDGLFYGTTKGYALFGDYGGMFKIDTNGNFTSLSTSHGYSPFANPESSLIQGADGGFYGTTVEGGDLSQNFGYGVGTVFRIGADGTLTIPASFSGTNGA